MHYFIDSTLDNIISIKQVRSFMCVYNHSITQDGGARYKFWQIVYVESGAIIEYSDDKADILGCDDILFHKPGEFSKSRSIHPEEPTNAYFITFECHSSAMELFAGYKRKLSDTSKQIMEKIVKEAKRGFEISTCDNVSMINRLPTSPIGGFQMFKILMESLMINILREENERNPNTIFTSKDDFDKSIHQNIVQYLNENIYENISLEDVCAKFNYSKNFLGSKFKSIEGTSIMNYMNRLKVEESCSLIKAGKYSMSHISNMLKFNNPYYFSRVFKRIKGITPMEYKKMLKNSDITD